MYKSIKNYINYLEKKESGIHIRVCLEVLNLQLKSPCVTNENTPLDKTQ